MNIYYKKAGQKSFQYFQTTLHLHWDLERVHCEPFPNLGVNCHIFPVVQSEKDNNFLRVHLNDNSSPSLVPYLWARKEERWAQSYLTGMRCNSLRVSNSSSFPENTPTLSYLLITLVINKVIEHFPCFRFCALCFRNILSFHSTLRDGYYYSHFTEPETEIRQISVSSGIQIKTCPSPLICCVSSTNRWTQICQFLSPEPSCYKFTAGVKIPDMGSKPQASLKTLGYNKQPSVRGLFSPCSLEVIAESRTLNPPYPLSELLQGQSMFLPPPSSSSSLWIILDL